MYVSLFSRIDSQQTSPSEVNCHNHNNKCTVARIQAPGNREEKSRCAE